MPGNPRRLTNFGGNIRFRPEVFYKPTDEAEVLAILDRHRGRRIRAFGALHSWSPCIAGGEIVLDLRRLDAVAVHRDGDCGLRVTVGAGCRIRRLLRELRRQGGLTLPSVGLIDAQSIAGAIATGTHGSGKHSISHYVTAVRAAVYDRQSGDAVIREWAGGDELRAARCGLGCTGIVLGVTLRCIPVPSVEEYTARHDNLDEVLSLTGEYPLQQAYFIPWLWCWYAHHRRERLRRTSPWAHVYRAYRRLAIDYLFHALVRLLANVVRKPRLFFGFYRRVFPRTILTGTRVVDRMDRVLLMRHQAFRHVETELFVPEQFVRDAMKFIRGFLTLAAGESDSLGDPYDELVRARGLDTGLRALHGVYVHHFPITLRRVRMDDTLISMSAGGDADWWAMSLITYGTRDLAGFESAMAWLARAMADLYGARPHWGKHCPLDAPALERVHPGLPVFREVCENLDPDGLFRNDFAEDKLGFGRPRNTL